MSWPILFSPSLLLGIGHFRTKVCLKIHGFPLIIGIARGEYKEDKFTVCLPFSVGGGTGERNGTVFYINHLYEFRLKKWRKSMSQTLVGLSAYPQMLLTHMKATHFGEWSWRLLEI